MNQRVIDILNYLDGNQSENQSTTNNEIPTSATTSNDSSTTTNATLSEAQSATNPKGFKAQSATDSSSETKHLNSFGTNGALDAFNDDKMYNRFSRQLKKKQFPMIFEGRVFNNEGEAQRFKQQVLAHRRGFKRNLKYKKINESQMNFDAMDSINSDSDDYEDLIEDDGYIYKKSKYPYAINKDKKKKIIPKTSKKDTKRIYKSIESSSGKEGIKHLVKAESDEDFRSKSDEAINKVDDDDIRNSYYNHTHNDFANDRTWNQESFLKLIYSMMKENEELKQANAKQQQQQFNNQVRSTMRLNPLLLKK